MAQHNLVKAAVLLRGEQFYELEAMLVWFISCVRKTRPIQLLRYV